MHSEVAWTLVSSRAQIQPQIILEPGYLPDYLSFSYDYDATYNPGHNILELYNILVQIQFTTSKRKLDIYYSKLGIQVASRVAKRLTT